MGVQKKLPCTDSMNARSVFETAEGSPSRTCLASLMTEMQEAADYNISLWNKIRIMLR